MKKIIQKMAELNKLEPNLYQWNNIRIAHVGKDRFAVCGLCDTRRLRIEYLTKQFGDTE